MSGSVHRIGVISDTHGLLRDEVKEILSTCQVILHGGDINKKELLTELGKIAPIYAVRGNNDMEWARELPESLRINLYGVKLFMIHDKKDLPVNLEFCDLIIYGHSHQYEEVREEGRILLNPGSCGPKRFRLPVTMALIEIQDGKCRINKVELKSHVFKT